MIVQDISGSSRSSPEPAPTATTTSSSSYSSLSSSTFNWIYQSLYKQKPSKTLKDLLSLWSSTLRLDNVNSTPKKKLGIEILLHFGLTFLITLWVRVVLANLRRKWTLSTSSQQEKSHVTTMRTSEPNNSKLPNDYLLLPVGALRTMREADVKPCCLGDFLLLDDFGKSSRHNWVT